MRGALASIGIVVCIAVLAGCGEKDERIAPATVAEATDPAAPPPRGWRTYLDRRAGFSISVPPGWSARRRGAATLVRSRDRLLAVSIVADRGAEGRETTAGDYARDTIASLPGYRQLAARGVRPVDGSPYESARADGAGTRESAERRQRVTAAAFRRPGQVTYAAVAFRDARGSGRMEARRLDRLLASLRARPPQR